TSGDRRIAARLDRCAAAARARLRLLVPVRRCRGAPLPAARARGPEGCALALQRARPAPRQLRAGGRIRALADTERIRRLLAALDSAAEQDGVCYLTGGATAVLLRWRPTTVDVDLKLVPEQDAVLRAIPPLTDE